MKLYIIEFLFIGICFTYLWLSILWLPAVATHLLVMPYINFIQYFMYKNIADSLCCENQGTSYSGKGFGFENNLPPPTLLSCLFFMVKFQAGYRRALG